MNLLGRLRALLDVGPLRARLEKLSARERLFLLVGAGAVVVIVAIRGMFIPALEGYRKARAAVPARRGLLVRYADVRAAQDNVAAAVAEREKGLVELEKGLLPGDDPSAAGAFLQGVLKPIVSRPDTRLTSIRTLAPVAKGAYSEVSVQMDLHTTTEGLATLLAAVPRETRILRVKKVTVTSPLHSAALANRPDSLSVSIVVAGMEKGAAADRQEEGRR